jgi:hypothetical protein
MRAEWLLLAAAYAAVAFVAPVQSNNAGHKTTDVDSQAGLAAIAEGDAHRARLTYTTTAAAATGVAKRKLLAPLETSQYHAAQNEFLADKLLLQAQSAMARHAPKALVESYVSNAELHAHAAIYMENDLLDGVHPAGSAEAAKAAKEVCRTRCTACGTCDCMLYAGISAVAGEASAEACNDSPACRRAGPCLRPEQGDNSGTGCAGEDSRHALSCSIQRAPAAQRTTQHHPCR